MATVVDRVREVYALPGRSLEVRVCERNKADGSTELFLLLARTGGNAVGDFDAFEVTLPEGDEMVDAFRAAMIVARAIGARARDRYPAIEPSSDRDTGFSMPPEDARLCPMHGLYVGDPVAPGVQCNGASPACRKRSAVFPDPEEKDAWRVRFEGRITSPSFNSRGAASAYLDALTQGTRKAEY